MYRAIDFESGMSRVSKKEHRHLMLVFYRNLLTFRFQSDRLAYIIRQWFTSRFTFPFSHADLAHCHNRSTYHISKANDSSSSRPGMAGTGPAGRCSSGRRLHGLERYKYCSWLSRDHHDHLHLQLQRKCHLHHGSIVESGSPLAPGWRPAWSK